MNSSHLYDGAVYVSCYKSNNVHRITPHANGSYALGAANVHIIAGVNTTIGMAGIDSNTVWAAPIVPQKQWI